MPTLTKPFLSLTAGDLMCTAVVTIPQHTSLQEAAHLLAQAGISGAPVVDAEGRCIGVLSAADFVSWVDRGEGAARQADVRPCCVHSNWLDVDPDRLPADGVERYMTADPVTVSRRTPLRDLARMMIDADIHRLIVSDGHGQLLGIVSGTDILAAVAYADVPSPEPGEW